MNKGLTGLVQHGVVINDLILIFGWTNPLTLYGQEVQNRSAQYYNTNNANSCWKLIHPCVLMGTISEHLLPNTNT